MQGTVLKYYTKLNNKVRKKLKGKNYKVMELGRN